MTPSPSADRWDDFDVVSYATDPEQMLPAQLQRWARTAPAGPYLAEVTGRSESFGETWSLVRRWATWLRGQGVGHGDHVATMIPSSIDAAVIWLALGCIGAVEVPVNPELVGDFMLHVLTDAAPVLCLARPELAERIRASRPDLPTITIERDSRLVAEVEPAALSLPRPADVACVIYTSGTSGPAKGVVIRWAQLAAVVGRMPLLETDVSYACHPMFHVTGRTPLITMADVGGRVVFRERFSLSAVLDDVERFGITTGTFAAALLLTLPPRPKDTTYPFRMVFTGHNTELNERFGERFGVRGYDCYGSTEVGFPIVRLEAPPDRLHGWCGKVRTGYEAKVVGPSGEPLAAGESGELLLRAGDRLMLMSHYLNRPDVTAKAFDGDWFRTGDIVVRHPDGNIEFLDRAKDTIRRMGENISTSAVEAAVEQHPDVAASAVIGVPDRVAGHEVLIAVEPVPDRSVDESQLYEWLRSRVPCPGMRSRRMSWSSRSCPAHLRGRCARPACSTPWTSRLPGGRRDGADPPQSADILVVISAASSANARSYGLGAR